MKEKCITVFLATLFLAISLAACGGDNTAATMHLVKTEGKVQVDNAEGKSVKVAENLGLYSGYEVSTLSESYGWITLDNTKLTKMDEASDVEIRKKGKQLELYVRFGSLFLNVTEPLAEDESMDIRTSTMAVGIRGTCGWVEVENKNRMCVYLLKGKVECTVFDEEGNVLSSETITAGQAAKMVLDGDKASITVAEFDTQRLPDFVEDALENPEDWGVAEAEGREEGSAENWGLLGGSGDPEGTLADTASGGEIGTAVDENGEVIDDIHVREEGDTLYFSGTGVIHSEDYEGYTPVKIVIEEGITGIGDAAFSICSGLTTITLPDSLKSIGDEAFRYCESLTSITLPGNLVSIGNNAFSSCIGLTTVTLPDSLKSIGDEAFDYCIGLTTITLPGSLESIGDEAFRYYSGLTAITLPDSVESIGDYAFSDCSGLTTITLSNSLESIGYCVFSHCSGLITITLPESVKNIGEHAFSFCSSLTEVTLSDSLESIGVQAFYDCGNLTAITLPDGLKSIGGSAFGNCSSLATIILPDSVESVGANVFLGCSGLTSITLSAGIESIDIAVLDASSSNLTVVRAPSSLRDTVESWALRYKGNENVFEWY